MKVAKEAVRKEEQKVTVPLMVVAPKEETKDEQQKIPTLQELKDRATILFLLQEKHTKLTEKRTSLDRFTITHEKENAKVTIEDVNGLVFKSSSPKTIAKLIEFWKLEFQEAISEIEKELKNGFDIAA